MTTSHARPKVRESLAVVEIDGEAVIYDEENKALHHLNPTATLIFSMCDGTATVKEFARDVAEAFHVSLRDVEREVRGLVAQFAEAGLLDDRTHRTDGR